MNANQIDWDAGNEQSHSNAIVMIHRLLRGKYILTLGLAIVLGVIGGTAGYLSQKPQYQSNGVIRIRPSLPKVLYESEQSTATKMFSSFVSSQAELIKNDRVIIHALESDGWKRVKDGSGIRTSLDVQRRLVVKPDRRAQEIVVVSFTDANPDVSATIVAEVMKSYVYFFGKEGSLDDPEITNALNKRLTDLNKNRRDIDQNISDITINRKTDNLKPLIENVQQAIRDLESQSLFYRDQIERYKSFQNETGSMTPEAAAKNDPIIKEKLDRRDQLISTRTEMMASEGLREEHRDVRRLTGMISSLNQQIEQRILDLQSDTTTTVMYDQQGRPVPSVEDLNRQVEGIDSQLVKLGTDSEALFKDSMALSTLAEDRENIVNSISQVTERLDQIKTESQVIGMDGISGKISVESTPSSGAKAPTSDPRIKFAGAGFIGAGSLPILVVLGIGYFSHRVQYSDDNILSGTGSGIIGMLPDLGNSIADKELAAASTFAVHQIRSQLQIKNASGETRVYGVTSPAPQDGKTSLIIAMGLSFAESGDRTLLVDLDFIGRGLSVHFGYPNAPSLAESLDSKDEVDSLTHDTEFEGLSILPAGFGDDERVSRLSPRVVGNFVKHLRGKYDTILIDTGPILGSVEAAFVAPQSDGVIMVIGRGQYKPLVKKAIDQVHAVDGNIVATIFNRALIQELRQSSSSMSVHFSRQYSRQQEEIEKRPSLRVGPVAGAIFRAKADQEEHKNIKSMKL